MIKSLKLKSEEERLKALRRYEVRSLEGIAKLNELVDLAANICEVPICVISLVEEEEQCFIAKKGIDVSGTTRGISFCTHAIQGSETLVIEDATIDPRFANNPLVTGPPYIRFYAGALLISSDGHKLGTLCVIDRAPRTLWETQQKGLEILARQVVTHLELRRSLLEGRIKLRKLKDAQRVQREKDALFLNSIRAMHDGFVLQDEQGKIIECNESACQILGLTEAQLKGRRSIDPAWHCVDSSEQVFPGERHPAMVALRTGEKQIDIPMGVHRVDGTMVWIKINAIPLFRTRASKPHAVLCTFTDVTEQRNRERRAGIYMSQLKELTTTLEIQRDELSMANILLHKLADCDGLTGLDNHRSLHRILEESLRKYRKTSLLLIDVDYFKKYNDSFGHPAGDAVLKQLASVMLAVVRPGDSVCRYGGEEFAIVLPDTDSEAAEAVAQRLLESVRKEDWPNKAVTLSVGICSTQSVRSKSALIEAADKALYVAKNAGRDRHHVADVQTLRKSA